MDEESGQPPWLEAAWRELGEREAKGGRPNPRIVSLYRDAGHPGIKSDATAWCAAFVGACLERTAMASTRSLLARSYLDWGSPIAEFRLGAVAVLSRTSDPALGHVGFLIGETGDKLLLLGGNQSDSVSVAAFDRRRLLGMRWPFPNAEETERPAADNDGAFHAALAHVLAMEGGFSDHPDDPGGPTYRGITLAAFADWRGAKLDGGSRQKLTAALRQLDEREIGAIYRERYWRPAGCGALEPGLALMHFDTAVNQGQPTAIRMLQELVGVAADGEFGPLTRAALAKADPIELIPLYALARERRYRVLPGFKVFGKGWLRRVKATRRAALRQASRVAASKFPSQSSKGDHDMTSEIEPATETKWWGYSLTIWGTLITTLSTVLPALGPLLGIELSAEIVRQLGDQVVATAQALAGLAGTVLAIYGRVRASQPLARREISLRL